MIWTTPAVTLTNMLANRSAIWLKRAAIIALFALPTSPVVSAQTRQPDLATALAPGMTAWITDALGREEKVRIVSVSPDTVTTTTRSFPATDVTRVRVTRADSVINGALIGAGAALAAGLFLCRLTEPWANCRDDVGPMIRTGGIGAGVGIGIDALIRGRKTIYDAAKPVRVTAAATVTRDARGLRVSILF